MWITDSGKHRLLTVDRSGSSTMILCMHDPFKYWSWSNTLKAFSSTRNNQNQFNNFREANRSGFITGHAYPYNTQCKRCYISSGASIVMKYIYSIISLIHNASKHKSYVTKSHILTNGHIPKTTSSIGLLTWCVRHPRWCSRACFTWEFGGSAVSLMYGYLKTFLQVKQAQWCYPIRQPAHLEAFYSDPLNWLWSGERTENGVIQYFHNNNGKNSAFK